MAKKGGDIEFHISSGHTNAINFVQVIDQSLYTASADGQVRKWSTANGALQNVLAGHTSAIICVKYSDVQMVTESGKVLRRKLYTGSTDNTARLWDLAKDETVRVFKGHTQQVSCLDVAQKDGIEGSLFTGSWDKSIRKWDSLTGELLVAIRGHTQRIYCMRVVGDLLYTGSRDGTARVWNTEEGQMLHNLAGHERYVALQKRGPTRGGGGVYCMEVLKGGLRALEEDEEHIDPRLRRHPALYEEQGEEEDVLLTGGADGTVRLWGSISGAPGLVIEAAPESWVIAMRLAEALLYTAAFDRMVRSHELLTGEPLQVFKGHAGPVWCLQVAEPYLYTGADDASVRIWDTNTAEQLYLLQGHEMFTAITCVNYHNGVVYSGCSDNTVRHWLLEGEGS